MHMQNQSYNIYIYILYIDIWTYNAEKATTYMFLLIKNVTEVKESRDITEKSNVYTLGVILIQLVTGKGPVDPEMTVHRQHLVEWARYCYSNCHIHTWIDGSITATAAAAADPNQIVGFMNLALNCTAADPMARPSSHHAYKTLLSLSRTTCSSKLCSS